MGCVSRGPDHVRRIAAGARRECASSPCPLDAQGICKSLYGLRLRADDVGWQALLQTLAAKTTQSQTVLGAQGAGNALYGLRPLGASGAARARGEIAHFAVRA